MTKPRAYTPDEVREMFLERVRNIAKHWSEQDRSPCEICDGVAFSILELIDGGTTFPAIDMSASPHPDDKRYHISNGNNWFAAGEIFNECQLHEEYYQ